jgi:protein TonB
MTRSYFTHLAAILLVHVLALLGTWQLSRSEYVRNQVTRFSTGALKLQVASQVMMTSPAKKTAAKAPAAPAAKPRPEAAPEEAPKAQSLPGHVTGSEAGTVAAGTTDVLAVYKAELRGLIDKNKYYPAISRRLGQTGTVVVAFTLLEDGHIIDVRIDKPSRYDSLNDSALAAVKKVERFRPVPKEVGGKMDVKVPVKFVTL